MMYLWVGVILLAVVAGVGLSSLERGQSAATALEERSGWVYFVSPVGGGLQEPPAPIKIGFTKRDPYEDRLPELETGSAQPLEMLYAFHTTNAATMEKLIHGHLEPFKIRREWYDRDVTLAFIAEIQ